MADVDATRNAAFTNGLDGAKDVAYWEHGLCRMRGWPPVTGVSDTPYTYDDMPVYMVVPGAGFTPTPFLTIDRDDPTGDTNDFFQNNTFIDSLRRAGVYVILISYPIGAGWTDSTSSSQGNTEHGPSDTGAVMVQAIAKAVQFAKTQGHTRFFIPSGNSGYLSKSASRWYLGGSSAGGVLASLVAFSDDGDFPYGSSVVTNSEPFSYQFSHRVRGVRQSIAALSFLHPNTATTLIPTALFGARATFPTYADVPEHVRLQMSAWERITSRNPANKSVGMIASYALIEELMGEALTTSAALLTLVDSIVQGMTDPTTGIPGYLDPHSGGFGPAIEREAAAQALKFKVDNQFHVIWGNPQSNPTGNVAWEIGETLTASDISFDAGDNSINSVATGVFANYVANASRWLHVTGANNAGNNNGFRLSSKPSDEKIIVDSTFATLIDEAIGSAITIVQNSKRDTQTEEFNFMVNRWEMPTT